MGKIGRNSTCPCGSGKKYKKCCLSKHEEEKRRRLSEANVKEEDLFEDLPEDNLQDDEDFEDVFVEDLPETQNSAESPAETSTSVNVDTEDVREAVQEPAAHKRPDLKLPKLPKEEQEIVDQWWEEFRTYYRERDADEMINRITSFMEDHPTLFVHLYLHEECLFELGGELGERKEWSRYAELLMRIRKEHPEVHVCNFGYYDHDIIAELVLTGRREEIPDYFSFFKRYHESDVDESLRVINLLAAAGFDDELFELVHAVEMPVWSSLELTGRFATGWLAFEFYIPYLSRKEYPDIATSELVKDLRAQRIPRCSQFDYEIVEREFESAFAGPPCWDIKKCMNGEDIRLFYHFIACSFCRFLHDRKNLSWATSRFLTCMIEEFLTDIPPGKRPKKAFNFNENYLEKHIVERYQSFFWVDGVQSMSLLRSIWYFTDYLLEHHMIEDSNAELNKQNCMRLFDLCKKAVGSKDPAPRLYAAFPEMKLPFIDSSKP